MDKLTVTRKKYDSSLEKLREKFGKDPDISIEPFFSKTKGAILLVDWAACGTVTPEYALDFAKRIERAANLASKFRYNGYFIEKQLPDN